MIRLLADENLDNDIVRGALRRRGGLDILRAQDVGLSETDDPEVPLWAAREQRVVLTHDVKTMIEFAMQRIRDRVSTAALDQTNCEQRRECSTSVLDPLPSSD